MSEEQNNNSIATIYDVARMAGASKSSVSRVINNQGGVSKKMELKIKEAIEVLRFKPNKVARALKAKSTNSLGLIIPSIENPVFAPLVKVIEAAADRYGFSIILCNSDGVVEKEAKYLQLLMEKQVDGIIFDATGEYSNKFEQVKDNNTPIIVIGKKIDGFETTNVTADNFKGAYLAVKYLIDAGAENIAFIFGALEAGSAINDRFEGYKAAIGDHGMLYRDELVIKVNRSFEGGINAADELLERGVKFDSVFVSNDIMAIGCIEKLLEKGFRIPDDICVIGYDDIPSSRIIKPRLSTVLNPVQELGTEAVKTVLRIIYTKKDVFHEKMFEPRLVIRDSTRNHPAQG